MIYIHKRKPEGRDGPRPESHSGHRPTAKMKGKAWTLNDIKSLARCHSRAAINVLAGIMRSASAPPGARVAAANALLDRGWGRAAQPIENGESGALELVHRIERVIVHPSLPQMIDRIEGEHLALPSHHLVSSELHCHDQKERNYSARTAIDRESIERDGVASMDTRRTRE